MANLHSPVTEFGSDLIESVLFDFDNTLIDRDAGFRKFCSILFRSISLISNSSSESDMLDFMIGLDKAGMGDRHKLFEEVIFRWPGCFENTDAAVEFYMNNYPKLLIISSETESMLKDLDSHGVSYGIVTNGGSEMQWAKIHGSGLSNFTENVLVSGDVGIEKPAPDIFRIAMDMIGADKDKTLFVGDNPDTDILGAYTYGLKTAWISLDREWERTAYSPDYVINHVSEVRNIVLG